MQTVEKWLSEMCLRLFDACPTGMFRAETRHVAGSKRGSVIEGAAAPTETSLFQAYIDSVGLGRTTLEALGVSRAAVDRIYLALFVYTLGYRQARA